MLRRKGALPKPERPSAEAQAQYKAKLQSEAALHAYAPAGISKAAALLKPALARAPIGTQEASPISGLLPTSPAVTSSVSSTGPGGKSTAAASLSSTAPSWYREAPPKSVQAADPVQAAEQQQELLLRQQQQKLLEQQQKALVNVYPPPIPPMTQTQALLRQKVDLVGGGSNMALMTANATASAGAEAIGLMGSAISYVVPRAIMEAPQKTFSVLQDAAESVGLDIKENFDIAPLDLVAASHLAAMDKQAALAGLSVCIKRLIAVLKGFRFNKAAATAFLRVVYTIISVFSKPQTGVIAVTTAEGSTRPLSDPTLRSSLAKIEEALHFAEKYLQKFASDTVTQPLPAPPTPKTTGAVAAAGGSPPLSTIAPSVAVGGSSTNSFALTPLPPLPISIQSPPFVVKSPAADAVSRTPFVCDAFAMLAVHESELEQHLKSFHQRLLQSVDEFLSEVGLSLGVFDISTAYPQFKLFGNLQYDLLDEKKDGELFHAASRSGSLDEVQRLGGMAGLKARVVNLQRCVLGSMVSGPHDLLPPSVVKSWWLRVLQSRQRITAEGFVKLVFMEAGGKSNIATDRLAVLEPNLVKALDLLQTEKDGSISLVEFAKFFSPVPAEETGFFRAVEGAVACMIALKLKIVPSLPAHIGKKEGVLQIGWSSQQEAAMGRVVNDNVGWTKITGPRSSGKTTRVLSILHSLSVDRDVVYVDLATCRDATDFMHAVTSQLLLRHCKSTEEFSLRFRAFLAKTIRAHGTVVFDHVEIDGLSPTESQVYVRSFETTIQRMCTPYASRCHFIVVSSSYPLKTRGVREFTVTALEEAQAGVLAKELLPVDPFSLLIAGRRLAGEMSLLARQCSLATIRKLAAIYTVDESAVSAGKRCLRESIEEELTPDQALAAACMLTGLSHFSEGHAWVLSKDAFGDDVLRWRVAWQGLVEVGWVAHSQPLGYWIPAQSILSAAKVITAPAPITFETQVRRYVFHWAEELVRVNGFSYECSSSMLLHDKFSRHFRSILSSFSTPSTDRRTAQEASAVSAAGPRLAEGQTQLALVLAGGLERVLTTRYPPAFAIDVAGNIRNALGVSSGVSYSLACKDYGCQQLRVKSVMAGKILKEAEANLGVDGPSWIKALFALALSNVYMARGDLNEAKIALREAARQLEAESCLQTPWYFTPSCLSYVRRVLNTIDQNSRDHVKRQFSKKRDGCACM